VRSSEKQAPHAFSRSVVAPDELATALVEQIRTNRAPQSAHLPREALRATNVGPSTYARGHAPYIAALNTATGRLHGKTGRSPHQPQFVCLSPGKSLFFFFSPLRLVSARATIHIILGQSLQAHKLQGGPRVPTPHQRVPFTFTAHVLLLGSTGRDLGSPRSNPRLFAPPPPPPGHFHPRSMT